MKINFSQMQGGQAWYHFQRMVSRCKSITVNVGGVEYTGPGDIEADGKGNVTLTIIDDAEPHWTRPEMADIGVKPKRKRRTKAEMAAARETDG